jgi:hypothetical protein
MVTALLLCFSWTVHAQELVDVQVPMGDGQWLAADVYLPDSNGHPAPAVLVQTPYNKNGFRNRQRPMVDAGYVMVVVDWRGRFGSTAAGARDRDLGDDGFDCVEWVAAQPWCDGQVATWGSSALGVAQFHTALRQPPHLVCMVPRVAGLGNHYHDYYSPGGVLRRAKITQLALLGFGDSAPVLANPVRSPLWDVIAEAFNPADVTVPVLLIGGWYDHNIGAVVRTFERLRAAGSAPEVRLLIGPWTHGQIDEVEQGDLSFPGAEGYAMTRTLQFLDHHLRGANNGWSDGPDVWLYRMGDDVWLQGTIGGPFPPSRSVRWHLHADGLLQSLPRELLEIALPYDPTDPSPTVGGARPELLGEAGPFDQAEVIERDDATLLRSRPLERPLQVCGVPSVRLWASTDRVDIDVAVRLIDADSQGRSILLSDGITRLRFAQSTREELFVAPGDSAEVSVTLDPVCHTFLPGHSIGLILSASNAPRFDANPCNGEHFSDEGQPLNATLRLLSNSHTPSLLLLPVTGAPRSADGRAR